MIEKSTNRLALLTKNLIKDKNMLEFLELYAILITEARNYEALEGVNSIREFLTGFKLESENGGVE